MKSNHSTLHEVGESRNPYHQMHKKNKNKNKIFVIFNKGSQTDMTIWSVSCEKEFVD